MEDKGITIITEEITVTTRESLSGSLNHIRHEMIKENQWKLID